MLRHTPALLALLLVAPNAACSDPAADSGDGAKDTKAPVVDVAQEVANPADAGGRGDDGGGAADSTLNCPGGCAHLDGPAGSCEVGQCDPQTGQCQVGSKPVGGPCDDGKPCTTDDSCATAGACAGKMSCPSQGPCQLADCDADGECSTVALSGPCNDGNACTSGDLCKFGSCTGTPIDDVSTCDDDNLCTLDDCTPIHGCVHLPAPASQPCDDDDICTQTGNCDGAGGCAAGPPTFCDDGDACTADGCKPGLADGAGCMAIPLPEGATCDDDSACTQDDNCQGGACNGLLIDDAKPSTTCTKLVCEPATAAISVAYAADGIACSDGAPCTIADKCKSGKCLGSPLVCNDGNPCTSDQCDPGTGQCSAQPVGDGQACNDGDGCTSGDSCKGGKCLGKGYQDTLLCDDSNPCTTDGCAPPSGCFHLPKGAIGCDDGDSCTILDVCGGGQCQGQAMPCGDGNPCSMDSCAGGNCQHVDFVGPCDDGDLCTTATLCAGGKCAGVAVNCDDANPCTNDICQSASGCKHLALPGGTPCDDGLSCTNQDQCDGGSCKGVDKCIGCTNDLQCLELQPADPCEGKVRCVDSFKGKVCALDPTTVIVCAGDGDPCSSHFCDPAKGSCKTKLSSEGLKCKSPDKCVIASSCSAVGKCVGQPLVCDDGKPCTVDACDPKWGCSHAARPDGSPCSGGTCLPAGKCMGGGCEGVNPCSCAKDGDCAGFDDGDLCNGTLACVLGPKGGRCLPKAGSAVSCPKPAEPCLVSKCKASTGQCHTTPVSEGGGCDDGNACTIKDKCGKGACIGDLLACDQGEPCRIYACDKVFGCDDGPQVDGGKCDDDKPCTASDACLGGKCQGKPVACDDGNPCTVDLCATQTGACATLLDNDGKCSDGDPCTTGDGCVDGKCVAKALACQDGNDCTIDACDGQGGCKHVLVPGKDCDDGDPCSHTDRCDGGGACAGKAHTCDDGNECTVEVCAKGACVITPETGKPCNDGDACTHGDHCDLQGSCAASPVDCDDGNPCTAIVGPCQAKSGCAIAVNDGKSCNDGDLCTIADKCAGAACQGIKLPCDDNNGCTVDTCAPGTGCINSQNSCADGNDCTFDKCDPPPPMGSGGGCLNPIVNGFQPCDDGSKCTVGGVCNGAACESKLVPCDDANPCTEDACDEGAGCVHLASPATTTCSDGKACTVGLCDGAGKCATEAKVCQDDNPCTQDGCHPAKGCVFVALKEGAACDDGCACTQGEQCQGGFCSGGSVTCPLCPKQSAGGCAIYDDNDLCNGNFMCINSGPCGKVAGVIAGGGVCLENKAPVICNPLANGPCLKNTCQSTTGLCKMQQMVNGTPCQDGLPCTVGDLCLGGQCSGGPPADCSAVADACNLAACVPDPGAAKGFQCVALPRPGTAAVCDADGDGCTGLDRCQGGTCKAGPPIECQGVAGSCQLAACQSTGPSAFTCKVTVAEDLSPCDDGQYCTAGDFCKGGKCQLGLGKPDCSALNGPCAKGACDSKINGGTGACVPEPIAEGKPCDADDNGCTVGDLCVSGQCIPGAWPDCTAKSSPCALGACKSTGSGTWSCVAAPANESKPCEADNNGCTQGDRCQGGLCTAGKQMDCTAFDGGGGCTIGTCVSLSASQGDCKGVAAKPGTACNADSNGCTQGDQCNKDGTCINGEPVNCLAFSGTCSTGQCFPNGADVHKFTCKGAPKADGQACDADGDGCSVGDACNGGQCVAGAAADCSAQSKGDCVVGSCSSQGADTYLCKPETRPNETPCDADGDGCTSPDVCVNGGCAKGPLQTCNQFASVCADSLCKGAGPSTWDCVVAPKGSWPALDPPTACTPDVKPAACPENYDCVAQGQQAHGLCTPLATIACDDDDACTAGDICSAGQCQPGPTLSCDDKDACTLDYCLSGKCGHSALPGCGLCVDEGFDDGANDGGKPSLPQDWVSIPSALDYAVLRPSAVQTHGGSALAVRAAWKGPYLGAPAGPISSRLAHRRLYLGGVAQLEFQLAMSVSTQACAQDNLQVLVNGVVVWQRCDNPAPANTKGGFEKISVDLAAWAGAPVELAFRVVAGTDAGAGGTVVVDAIKLTGQCGPACLGEHFEPDSLDDLAGGQATPRLPQPWRVLSTATAWLNWKIDNKLAHSGKFALRAAWLGPSPDGGAHSSRLRVPLITPIAGDKLRFALLAETLANGNCAEDTLRVTVAGQTVVEQCAAAADWQDRVVDLTPWAGQTVDIEFVAQGGGAESSAGLVLIDDITVSGGCTWACFHERFDDGDLAVWQVISKAPAGPAWQIGKELAKSPPAAARGTIGAGAELGSDGRLLADVNKGGRLRIPVGGASYSYAANLAMKFGANGSDDLCKAAPGGGPMTPLMLTLRRSGQWGSDQPPAIGAPQAEFAMANHCKASSGWQTYSGKINAKAGDDSPSGPRGLTLVPAITLRTAALPAQAEVWLDDLLILCR